MAYQVGNISAIYELNGVKYPLQIDTADITSAFDNTIVYPTSATKPQDRGTGVEVIAGGENNDTVVLTSTYFDIALGGVLNAQQEAISNRRPFSERRGKLTITSLDDPNQQIILDNCVPSGTPYQPNVDNTALSKWNYELRGNLIKQFTGYERG